MPLTTAKQKLCLALDVDSAKQAVDLANELKDYVGLFKIGLEIFLSDGPGIVKAVADVGGPVFLDLKFHDIPNTVARAARSATRLGVAMFDVHAAGGHEMITAAATAAHEEAERLGVRAPIVLAVTVLTSINETLLHDDLLVQGPLQDAVVHLASMSKAAGANGVIASPKEISLIRDACGPDFLIITPGIRPTWATTGDQKRITTPREAVSRGSDYIVVGRPILDADNHTEAARTIVEELADVPQAVRSGIARSDLLSDARFTNIDFTT